METNSFNDDDEVIKVAMEIILSAGEAKTEVQKSLDAIGEFHFDEAKSHLEQAQQNIVVAHNAQTSMIQGEMSGEETNPPCLLFNHAQDTLMTTMTEVNLTKNLIMLFENFYNKMEEK